LVRRDLRRQTLIKEKHLRSGNLSRRYAEAIQTIFLDPQFLAPHDHYGPLR